MSLMIIEQMNAIHVQKIGPTNFLNVTGLIFIEIQIISPVINFTNECFK